MYKQTHAYSFTIIWFIRLFFEIDTQEKNIVNIYSDIP
jgi:hypothetical protein